MLHQQTKQQRHRWIAIATVGIIAALLGLIVPLAIILPKKSHPRGLPSNVLLPLYIYPVPGAWDPLWEALNENPGVNFTVVVNPDSGPGADSLPGTDYSIAVQNLTAYPNVRTIGYVRTTYGARNVSEILQDISTYSNWGLNDSSIAVHGIFFDEVVSDYSPEAATTLTTINQAVKNAPGIFANKTVIHNPGTIPQSGFNDINTDITIVLEASYDKYKHQQPTLAALPLDRSRYSYVVHSAPSGLGKGSLKDTVNGMSRHAEYLFVTNRHEYFYEGWGSDWEDFVEVVPS